MNEHSSFVLEYGEIFHLGTLIVMLGRYLFFKIFFEIGFFFFLFKHTLTGLKLIL